MITTTAVAATAAMAMMPIAVLLCYQFVKLTYNYTAAA